ncbi:MAG TPA: cytochrome P450 [Magnetospirillaceae bacterium]|jgi:cytochrome P450
MDGSSGTVDPVSTITIPPQMGPIEFMRRLRRDQLSVLSPEVYSRPLIYNRFLFLRSYFVNKPEYIEHILVTNAANYVKSHIMRRLLEPLVGKGLLTSEGDFWRRQRRIAAPAFHHKRIAGFVATMATSSAAWADTWPEGRAFDLSEALMGVTLEIIAKTMFSANVSGVVQDVRRLLGTVMEYAKPGVLDMFGFPEIMPRRVPKAYRDAVAELDALIEGFVAPRRADEQDRGDLLSMLLAARDPETGEGMTPTQLRDEVMTIFLAGHETTSNALTWTWYLLAQHPDVAARLEAEVDQALQGRVPAYEDLAKLPYARMVVEEAIRLYPPAHSISRTALHDDILGRTRIPAGSMITISPHTTHRNPTLWPDPERFDPERFAPGNGADRHRFAYLPFGGGPRICIGNSFAITEALTILAATAQRWRIALVPERPVEPVGLITLRPASGLWVTAKRR